MLRLPTSLLLLVSSTFGCVHIERELPEQPPPSAPLATRAAAYERVRPSALGTAPAGLLLATGDVVNDPMKLQPLVERDSKTMKHARKMRELEDTATWIGGASIGAGALGIAGEIVALAWVLASQPPQPAQPAPPDGVGNVPPPPAPSNDAAFALSIGSAVVGVVGMFGLMIPAVIFQFDAVEERKHAFESYEPDLRERLDLQKLEEKS